MLYWKFSNTLFKKFFSFLVFRAFYIFIVFKWWISYDIQFYNIQTCKITLHIYLQHTLFFSLITSEKPNLSKSFPIVMLQITFLIRAIFYYTFRQILLFGWILGNGKHSNKFPIVPKSSTSRTELKRREWYTSLNTSLLSTENNSSHSE